MSQKLKIADLDGAEWVVEVDEFPDRCPSCHHAVQPLFLCGHALAEIGEPEAQLIFACSRRKCQRVFIADYYVDFRNSLYRLGKIYPTTPEETDLPDEIIEMSPEYSNLMAQALAAEAYGLDQLVGIGLRKGLEFLVKDYLVQKNPSEKDLYESLPLGKCIKNHIDSANIRLCAERAAWLGNDETHYKRKWVDRDIGDLKILIQLTLNWIQNELLTKKYTSEMRE